MNILTPQLRKNGTLTPGNNPNKIILHHPEWSGTPEDLNEMEITNPDDPMVMSGYNYYVRKDGAIYQMRPTWSIGANCYGQNSQSIGIAAEGNFMVDTMPEVQKQSIIDLSKYLMSQNSNITEVGPHKKYYNTDCPGTNYPIDEIINSIYSKGDVKMKNLILYNSIGDFKAVSVLSSYLQAPAIQRGSETKEDAQAINLYEVGGTQKYPNSKLLSGSDSIATELAVFKLMGRA